MSLLRAISRTIRYLPLIVSTKTGLRSSDGRQAQGGEQGRGASSHTALFIIRGSGRKLPPSPAEEGSCPLPNPSHGHRPKSFRSPARGGLCFGSGPAAA